MNRVLLTAVIILSLSLAGVIGYTVAHQQLPRLEPAASQQPEPKYTQQEIADMQAELEEVEVALAKNEEEQEETRSLIYQWQYQAQVAQEFANSYSDSSRDWLYPDYDEARGRSWSQESAMRGWQRAVSRYQGYAMEQQATLYHLQDEHQKLLERKLLLMMKLEATQ